MNFVTANFRGRSSPGALGVDEEEEEVEEEEE
ncbi:hypothetical protein M0802_000362 [Mischocyttarus mexicanus]|nr:hypothetical protein M0802_000362 [Mischocyttarus mexicanus]